jgi:hypothetical protein
LPDNTDNLDEQQGDQPKAEISAADEKLLKQIREDYRYCLDYWRDVREEAETDMQYVAGNPWTQDDIEERKGRPCLTPDELSQYLKQANNNLRQNKRAIQVNPKGEGATDEDARLRSAIIRGIEYESNAQSAYTCSFEQATSCGFGAFRLTTKEIGEHGEVTPRIKRIPNQFTVLLDPNAREADFSDAEICFVTDILRIKKFAETYHNAVKRSFSKEDSSMAPDWIDGENIVIAEYWTRKGKTVTQYITNGVEILEKNEWAGSWIPIIPVLGEEIYVQGGGRSKRMFLSLIRRARAAQKMLCFIASQQAEEFGMSPRSPFLIWEGQDQADPEAWKNLNKVPRAFVKIKPIRDEVTGQLLPPPIRQPFIPNAEAYEVARESWRRAVQAAMGIMPLPTSAQRQNEKSGIALDKIQTAEATGSFHFTDNFDRALENCGRQLNELITKTMDTPRQVSIRQKDDQHSLLYVAAAEHEAVLQGKLTDSADADYLITDRGEYDVTISTGPSYQSQREQAQDFADTVLKEVLPLPDIPGPVKMKLFAKAVKLKNAGPVADEIIDIIDPPEQGDIPPQAQAAIAQAQGQAQQAGQEVARLTMERDAKVLDNAHKMEIEKLKQAAENERQARELEARITIAEIEAKSQIQSDRESFTSDEMQRLHVSAHEQAMQQHAQEHQKALADQAAQVAAAQQATQISADQQAQEQPTGAE